MLLELAGNRRGAGDSRGGPFRVTTPDLLSSTASLIPIAASVLPRARSCSLGARLYSLSSEQAHLCFNVTRHLPSPSNPCLLQLFPVHDSLLISVANFSFTFARALGYCPFSS